MSRPSKLTPNLSQRIVEALRLGATREHAASYAGISPRTLYNWLSKGSTARNGMYLQFFQDVKKAEGENTVSMLGVIKTAAQTDWKAAAWCLERCRGYTRTNAIRVAIESQEEDVRERDAESAREMLMRKLEQIARTQENHPDHAKLA